jgi:hypothetical protein
VGGAARYWIFEPNVTLAPKLKAKYISRREMEEAIQL